MSKYFYGWYYRCQGTEGTVAVIPSVSLSEEKASCSVQIITQKESLYQEFPISQFRINRKKGVMQIGKSLFSRGGIRLDFVTDPLMEKQNSGQHHEENAGEKIRVRGCLRFGPFSKPRYDIMGPFALLSAMECRHAVYSMRHTVNGELKLNGDRIRFCNGAGYMEGDSGVSFPDRYIWTQHFLPEGSVMLAAASVPLAGIRFTGTVAFFLINGREYRFATYLGARVNRMNSRELLICQGPYRLRVRFSGLEGNMLKAPDGGRMIRQVREDVSCGVEYTLLRGNRVLFRTKTGRAAAEYDLRKG